MGKRLITLRFLTKFLVATAALGLAGCGGGGSGGTTSVSAVEPQASSINYAPELSGTPATSVSAGTRYIFAPQASDRNNDKLSFYAINPPSWARFDTSTGVLSGTPGSGDIGNYNDIRISVSDGIARTRLAAFSIEVTGEATGGGNTAPTIAGTPAIAVDAGSRYLFRPVARDVDGDRLSFRIANRPGWASFDSSTGVLSGVPANSNAGTYNNIVISVSDGTTRRSLRAFSIQVRSVVAGTPGDTDPDPVSPDPVTPPPNPTLPNDGGGEQLGAATVNWQAPTQRADGESLAANEIDGYRIYYGTSSGRYSFNLQVSDASATSSNITDLPLDTYYFVVTAYDSEGRESGYSNEVVRVVR